MDVFCLSLLEFEKSIFHGKLYLLTSMLIMILIVIIVNNHFPLFSLLFLISKVSKYF